MKQPQYQDFFFEMINYVFVVAKFAPSSLKCSVYGEVSRYIIIHFVLVRISEFQLMNACLDFQQNIFDFRFKVNFNSSDSKTDAYLERRKCFEKQLFLSLINDCVIFGCKITSKTKINIFETSSS